MIKKVKIIGLDCAHCAKTLENEINKIQGVKNAEINFVQSTLQFESDEPKESLSKIVKLTAKVEPEAEIIDEEAEFEEKSSEKIKEKSEKKHSERCHCGEHHHEEGECENDDCCDEDDDCCSVESDCCGGDKGKHHHHEEHQTGKHFECCCEGKKHCHNKKLSNTIQDVIFLTIGVILGVLSLIFTKNVVVHYVLLIASVLCLGWKIYIKAFRLLTRGVVNENLLLTISVAGAIAINKDMEAVMVIALYSIGKILEGLAVNKSRKSIEKITNFKPQYAVVIRDGEEIKVNPSEVKLGETIIVRPGECVPIDCEILTGVTNLNTQSLTGESLPVSAIVGEKVLSGSIVLDGVITAKTTTLYKDSTVSKILNLIENNQQKKSKAETVISKVTKWYTLGVIGLALLTFGIVFLVTKNFQTALYRGLIFLVISCPCAFAISVPLSYFSGLGNASSKGILIKGTTYLDACAKIKTVVFDKTGTLTTGKFSIEKIEVEDKKLTEKDALKLAGIGEQYSIHPLAKCITESVEGKLPEAKNVKEVAGEGVYFAYNKKEYFVGRRSKNLAQTCVELFEADKLLAKIYLHDSIKETSADEIAELKEMGIKTVLLSGDKKLTVQKIVDKIKVDEFESELLPQEKSKWIEDRKSQSKDTLAFVGDGLNDAPSLTIADVGFCMGLEGNPASVEASDIVLSDDNPNKISKAIKISKYTRKIVWENIGFSAFIKIMFLTLGAFGVTGMLSAVIADVGVTVLAILNSLRALNYKPNKDKK